MVASVVLLAPRAHSDEAIKSKAPGGQDNKAPRDSLVDDRTRSAIEGSLRWLADQQNTKGEAKGSWNGRIGFKINDGYRLQPLDQTHEGLPHLGVTALAAMAFLSGGHLPGQGPYGDTTRAALDFVLKHVRDNGYITAYGSRMYSHAFSLLFLTEIYGMTGDPKLRKKLDKAVEFTYRAQNKEGGWRYAPLAQDSDMSITVCQVVALREARNIGIKVPRETIDKALKYVMESAVVGRNNPNRGAFLYQHSDVPFNRNSFALTAAGLTTIYQAGLYNQRELDRYCAQRKIRNVPRLVDCLQYIEDTYEPIWRDYHDHYFYFYGCYYATQAWYTRGGKEWRRWYTRLRDDLMSIARHRRGADGKRRTYWESRHVGDVYATAVSAIMLQVPTNYLPIFQR
ncbi:MAG: prenyltransferase/squalene oxidase repeat-containing protein [Planctomycetota bacterium]